MIRQRCAIYTRKSTEEGLEQDFNTLDAQRESCAAYVLSQTHEGWSELPDHYDDGGYSGGSMERPALQRLLKDVEAGRVDVIVVYKVDRLTRSLVDFAKMVEIFDGTGVSFVSVTQAFNTTSSMGRLTLNVLLSFAQFEREVTAERIRDKVAASKRKGMWMGGMVPFGYDVIKKALIVNPKEAEAVRTIFSEYLVAGTVRELLPRLEKKGIVSKQRTDRYGRQTGGAPFSRGAISHILRSPIYIGKVRHNDVLYEGLHEALIDNETWQKVQETLVNNGGKKHSFKRKAAKRVLDGKLFDANGSPMCTTYTDKSMTIAGVKQSKRYWYYVTKRSGGEAKPKIMRLPAIEVERLMIESIQSKLADRFWLADRLEKFAQSSRTSIAALLDMAGHWSEWQAQLSADESRNNILKLLERIDVVGDILKVQLKLQAVIEPSNPKDTVTAEFEVKFHTRQNKPSRAIMINTMGAPCPDPDLIKLVGDARRWADDLLKEEALTIKGTNEREDLRSGSVSRILPLAWLAPDISKAILEGRQPENLTTKVLRELPDLPLDWDAQRKLLGFAHL